MKFVGAVILATVLTAAGCDRADQPRTAADIGFPQGNAVAGKQAFTALGCAGCHEVYGGDLPKPTASPVVPVYLGGNRVQLPPSEFFVREIVDPSHRISPGWAEELVKSGTMSRMPSNYSEAMTVRQLIDIVAFLSSRYGAQAEENVKKQQGS